MKKRFNPIKDKSSEIIEFLMASPDMPTDEAIRFKIHLSIEEAVENVVRYAYEGGIGWLEAGTSLDKDRLVLTVELRDAGVPFNPLEREDPDITWPVLALLLLQRPKRVSCPGRVGPFLLQLNP